MSLILNLLKSTFKCVLKINWQILCSNKFLIADDCWYQFVILIILNAANFWGNNKSLSTLQIVCVLRVYFCWISVRFVRLDLVIQCWNFTLFKQNYVNFLTQWIQNFSIVPEILHLDLHLVCKILPTPRPKNTKELTLLLHGRCFKTKIPKM